MATGNNYAYWYIDNNYQVFAVDSSNQVHSKSQQMFAMDIGTSDNGTLWAISMTPDPGGGISGYTDSSCIYL